MQEVEMWVLLRASLKNSIHMELNFSQNSLPQACAPDSSLTICGLGREHGRIKKVITLSNRIPSEVLPYLFPLLLF